MTISGNLTLNSVYTLKMASVEALEAQEIPPRTGDWLNKELHPTIRKRTLALEAEYEDSGGTWAYTDWRRHQSWSRYESRISHLEPDPGGD
jgi:hypothetical protein